MCPHCTLHFRNSSGKTKGQSFFYCECGWSSASYTGIIPVTKGETQPVNQQLQLTDNAAETPRKV